MAVRARHSKTSGVADSGDTNLVQPSDWNADHPITADGPGLLGRTAAGAGAVSELSAADGRSLLALGSAAQAATTDFAPASHVGVGGAAHATATSAAAGFMSAGDKAKLDGVAASATNTPLSSATPAALGTAAVGTGTTAARADHVHPLPTTTLTGDLTGSGAGSVPATVANNAISNAKLADVPTATIKGRITAAVGDPEDLTAAQARTVLNVADGATANATDAALRDRATHTGTQPHTTITGLGTAATHNTGTSGATVPLLNGANTWSAQQTFGSGPRINGAAGTARRLEYYTTGSIRWQIGATADAESGSNAGTNFNVLRHSDAGALIDVPFSINRATGATTVTSLTIGANPTSAVQAGTVTGQLARWNNTAARYEPVTLNTLADAADDAAAATAGVTVGGLYRTGSILKTRIA